jgi:hypothetical protein
MSRRLPLLACIALAAMASAQVPVPKALASDDAPDRVFTDRLKTMSAPEGGHAIDCGITTANRPESSVAACGQKAFEQHTPFFLGYETLFRDTITFAYGMAGDATGRVFSMTYQGRAYPPVALNRHMQLMDGNHTRVIECSQPVTLESTARGLLACTAPVNQEESEKAAGQKPLDTTVCAVLANPAAFNNKIVRIRGHYSGNFEYSMLSGDGCNESMWFGYGGGSDPPNLAAYVSTGNVNPGSEDSEGRRILPVPVKLIRDSKFERFEKAVRSFSSNHEVVPLIGGAAEPKFVTATFIGRVDAVSIEVHEFLKKQPAEHRSAGLGFGQMGQFEAQFILQSVEDDATLE